LVVKPYLIGLAGGSGSGKTALARKIADRLPPSQLVILELDSYYLDRSGMAPESLNFDVPSAFDHELLSGQVRALARGEAVDKPLYDFAAHARLDRTERIVPRAYILIEGLFALYWPEVRDQLDLKVFVDADDRTRLERRLARDVLERSRTRESIEAQYRRTVRPMFESQVRPTRAFADLILDGRRDLDDMAAEVVARLRPPRF
jgi:uridine kinase